MKKLSIFLAISLIFITACNENPFPPEPAETAVTAAETTVTEAPVTKKPTFEGISNEELDAAADNYLKALKNKDFTEHFGVTLSEDECARAVYEAYFDEVTFTTITRSEGTFITSDSYGYDRSFMQYDVAISVSESNNMRFPVGVSEWTMEVSPSADGWITIFPKSREWHIVTPATLVQLPEVVMCYNFSQAFGLYEDCGDISSFSPSDNRGGTDGFYSALAWYLYRSGITVETEQDFYDGAEKLLGRTDLDVNQYTRYKEHGAAGLVPPPRGGSWDYCAVYDYASDLGIGTGQSNVILDFYADSSYLVPAKRISYTLENTEYGHRLVSMKVLEDTGCMIAGGSV